jgi:hypothetical protein
MRYERRFLMKRLSFYSLFLIVGLIGILFPNIVNADNVWLQIAGDPLIIRVEDCAQMGILFEGISVDTPQYFSTDAKGSTLFLNGTSQFSMGSVPAGGCGGTLFTPISHSKPDDWSVETIYDAGSTGVRITQRIYYTNGNSYYRLEWDIENTGENTYTDCRFLHGGDTYFDGNDSSKGYYNAILKMVYLKNPDNEDAGIMGLYGHPDSPIDRYNEGGFSINWDEMDDGELPNTVNEDYIDAGYSVQWNRANLVPGDTWHIIAFEKWTGAGSVQVYAPADEDVLAGEVKSYTFIIQSFQDEQATYNLSASSSNGWATNLPNGGSITLAPDGADSVIVELTVPAGTSEGTVDYLTLTATDDGNPEITNSDFVTSTVLAAEEEEIIIKKDKDENSCFLETVLGIAMAKDKDDKVIVLRRFRDENLLTNPIGEIFVSTYYRISPVMVGFAKQYPVLNSATREVLKPLIWLCEKVAGK